MTAGTAVGCGVGGALILALIVWWYVSMNEQEIIHLTAGAGNGHN